GWCLFFFQAEDGIRDFHVTGVQTCALPISSCDSNSSRKALASSALPGRIGALAAGGEPGWPFHCPTYSLKLTSQISARLRPRMRSEERRVGKGCRSRWSREG